MADFYGFTYFTTELRDEGILWVAFNRPERRNAITPEMHAEIAPLFRRISEDRSVSVVVLTGAGDKAFCAGADFGGMQENLDAGYEDGFPDLMIGSADVVRSQIAIPQPVIAAINGDAIGLGATMALFCDIVYMAEEARIADPHVKAGLGGGRWWRHPLAPASRTPSGQGVPLHGRHHVVGGGAAVGTGEPRLPTGRARR